MSSSFVCGNPSKLGTETEQSTTEAKSISIIASEYVGTDVQRGITGTGPGSRYLEHDVSFYQLFTLGVDLELTATLCATSLPSQETLGKYEAITEPTVVKETKKVTRLLSALKADPFIVPDDFDDDDGELSNEANNNSSRPPGYQQSRVRGQSRSSTVDFSLVFEQLFPEAVRKESGDDGPPEVDSEDCSEFIQALRQRIEDWKEEGEETILTTL